MNRKIKLALIGFNTEIIEEIAVMVEQVSLGIVLSYHDAQNGHSSKKEKFKLDTTQEFDLVLLNAQGFSNPAPEVIGQIKSTHPLVQIVLVTFSQDYRTAVESFRAGARDLLEYPLSKTDLTVSLQRAATYRSFYKRSESMIEILNLVNSFSDWRRFETEEKLFQGVNDFLMKKLRSAPFVILTVSSASATLKNDQDNYQVYFNQDTFKDNYGQQELQKIFEAFRPREIDRNFYPYAHYVVGGASFFLIGLGVYEQKRFLGMFKIPDYDPETLPMDFVGHFSRLIKNATDHLFKSKRQNELVSLAHTDDVTGLFNQRKLYLDLDESIKRYEKDQEPFCVIFIDVDHFKKVNDGQGHLTGSLLLVQLANEMKKMLRETDYVYRYGGDEFVVIIPNAGVDLGKEIGERILTMVKNTKFSATENSSFQLGLSIGIAAYPDHAQGREDILRLADSLMYQAKQTGRGRVCLAHEALGKTPNLPKKKAN